MTRCSSEKTSGQQRGRGVDDGVPRDDPSHRGVGEVQCGQAAGAEGDLGVAALRLGDHPRREVDAADVEAEGLQVPGDPAGAAADVDDRAAALEVDELGEVPQQGPVERAACELVLEQPRVVGGHRVVCRPRLRDVQRLDHLSPSRGGMLKTSLGRVGQGRVGSSRGRGTRLRVNGTLGGVPAVDEPESAGGRRGRADEGESLQVRWCARRGVGPRGRRRARRRDAARRRGPRR